MAVCVSVCPHNRTKTAETNYNHQTCHRDSPSWVLAIHLILGQRSGSQDHKVISVEGDRVAGVSLHSVECLVRSNTHRLKGLQWE